MTIPYHRLTYIDIWWMCKFVYDLKYKKYYQKLKLVGKYNKEIYNSKYR